MARTPAWQRKEGQNPKGGLNAKGRASYNKRTGGNLKAPVGGAADTPQKETQRLFPSKDGVFCRTTKQRWEEDEIETLTRSLGALW